MALGAEHVETPESPDLVALFLADRAVLGQGRLVDGLELLSRGLEPAADGVAHGQALEVPAEDYVDATAGHVGRDRHGVLAAGLGHDVGFTEVLLGVEHLVGDAGLGESAAQQLGLLHRRGAQQNRLAAVAAFAHVGDDGVELRLFGLVDQVGLVVADVLAVRGDRHDAESVGVAELAGLCFGRSGHAGQLLVKAEVVLQGHGGPRVVLSLIHI